jgi:FkbM family methyltransferase
MIFNIEGIKFRCKDKFDKIIFEDATRDLKIHRQQPLRTVVDIGAHMGSVSLYAAKIGAQKVYALEPSWENYSYLVHNILLNGFYSIIPIKSSVVKNSFLGFEKLRYGRYLNSGQKSLLYRTDGFDEYESVGTIGFKDILKWVINYKHNKEHHFNTYNIIDYLKIDIEGGEFDFLDDTDEELIDLLNKVRYINLEIHPLDNEKYFNLGNKFITTERLISFMEGIFENNLSKIGMVEGRYFIVGKSRNSDITKNYSPNYGPDEKYYGRCSDSNHLSDEAYHGF